MALAVDHPVGKLVLEAPYSSIADIAAANFPLVPVGWLLRDPFHSDQRIARVRAPLLIMHGDRDLTIPIRLAEKLFSLAHEPKQFVRFPEGGHDNLADQAPSKRRDVLLKIRAADPRMARCMLLCLKEDT